MVASPKKNSNNIPIIQLKATSFFLFSVTVALILGSCHSSLSGDYFDNAPSYSADLLPAKYVVHISVDGLRQDAVVKWLDDLPGYKRLRTQGAFTDNARTTPSRANTLPNHTSQLTGRIVAGPRGHGWDTNRYADPSVTIHSNRGSYVTSVFDVVDGAGLKNALFASKSKFSVFENSYKDKIDIYRYHSNTSKLTDQFVDSLRTGTYAYLFLHLRNPDTAGHRFGWRLWSWHPYARAVRKSDRSISQILSAIDRDPVLRGNTAVIVTADHGGHGHTHGADNALDFTVPFYVWGPGIPAADLYVLTAGTRSDPGISQVADSAAAQPIRNGDAANLALFLIDLPPISGSTLGAERPLLQRLQENPDW